MTMDHNDLFSDGKQAQGSQMTQGKEGTKLRLESRTHNKKIMFKSLSFVMMVKKASLWHEYVF